MREREGLGRKKESMREMGAFCAGETNAGGPCPRRPIAGLGDGTLCRYCHSRAGQADAEPLPDLDLGDGEPEKLRRALCQVANEVRSEKLKPQLGTAIAQILRVVFIGENDEVWGMIRSMRMEREAGRGQSR